MSIASGLININNERSVLVLSLNSWEKENSGIYVQVDEVPLTLTAEKKLVHGTHAMRPEFRASCINLAWL